MKPDPLMVHAEKRQTRASPHRAQKPYSAQNKAPLRTWRNLCLFPGLGRNLHARDSNPGPPRGAARERSTVRRDSCHLYVTKPACLHRARQVQRGGRWCLRGARAIRKGLSDAAPLTPAHTTRIGAAAPSCVEPHFSAPPRFRTFQICPKDLPVTLQQVERTADRSTTAPRRRKADVRHGAPALSP